MAIQSNSCSRANSQSKLDPQSPGDLNSVLQPILKKYDLPALAGAIVTSDGVVASGAVGVRKYGSNVPVTINDQFHLGSDTKAMTATILAMEVEKGKLDWTTTLATALPQLATTMDPAYRSVTIEQLLSHRAGFTADTAPRGMTLLDLHNLSGSPRQQRWVYAQKILAEPPEVTPGTKFIYSNRSYAVAGVIAETIADKPWEDLMREWLFAPLDMDTCGFGAMGTPGKLDQPLQHTLLLGMHRSFEPGPLTDNPVAMAPAGLVHCSILDWAKFVQAHLRGEKNEPGILRPETLKELHTPPYGDYAFGWIVVERAWAGGRALTHGGSNTMNYANVWMAPLKDFALLAMTNQGGDAAAKATDDTIIALNQFRQRKP